MERKEQDRPSQSVLSVIAAELNLTGADGTLRCYVDGAAITAEANGNGARLISTLPELDTGDDAAVRDLMARYMPHAVRDQQVLCLTGDSALQLVADVRPDDDVPQRLAAFCDAAVFWNKAGRARTAPRVDKTGYMNIIFP